MLSGNLNKGALIVAAAVYGAVDLYHAFNLLRLLAGG